jgi:2-iminobutanoate/2-iminopropanoate deaminase
MSKEMIHTNEAPHSIASYSQAVKAAGLVFVSGQGPFDAKTGEVVGATIQEQTAQCLRNVEAILRQAGSSLDQAVNATFILGEEADFPGMNGRVGDVVPEEPARAAGRQTADSPKGNASLHCSDRGRLTGSRADGNQEAASQAWARVVRFACEDVRGCGCGAGPWV